MASAGSVKRNVLASWFAHGVTIVIGFFLMPYVIRILGDHQYGTWVFVNSIASYAGLLYFGFGDTISRYVARYQSEGRYDRINEIVTLIQAIYLVMGGVALMIAAGVCIAAPWISAWQGHELLEVRLTILVLGLNVATGLAGSVFGGVLMGLRRFDLERTVSFSSDIVRLALIAVFLRQEWGILTIAIIYWFITLFENIAFAAMAYRCLPELKIRRSFLSWTVFRECSAFSSMAFLNAIAYQMTNATDSVVIGFMLGTDAIVPYYIALRLTQFLKQPIDKIAHICMPTAGALSTDGDRSRFQRFLLKALGVVFLLTTSVYIGAWFFGGHVITAWVGDDYGQSHRILTILLAAQMVALPCSILRAFLFGLGQVQLPAILYLVEACCNLTLSIVLCHYVGLIGIAWGTAIPVILIEFGILMPLALKQMGISYQRLWQAAVAPQLLPVGALWVYSFVVAQQPLDHHSWPMLIAITLGGGAVLGLTWLVVQRGRTTPSLPVAAPSA